jgi:hypothetical protein
MTQFELWFRGGKNSIIIDAPEVSTGLGKSEKVDGLDPLRKFLDGVEWLYSGGKLIHVPNIDFITIVRSYSNIHEED